MFIQRTPNHARYLVGFTLIELLAVISIVTLLISLLLPGLTRARDQARAVVCADHHRQWALAFHAYTLDNTGALPWFAAEFPCCGGSFWIDATAPYLGLDVQGAGDARVRACPTGEAFVGVNYGGFHSSTPPIAPINYETDRRIAKRYPPLKLEQVRHPSTWFMLFDTSGSYMYSPAGWTMTVDFDGDGIADSHDIILATQFPYNGAKPRVHDDAINVATCDGHVERMPYQVFLDVENGHWRDE